MGIKLLLKLQYNMLNSIRLLKTQNRENAISGVRAEDYYKK